MRRLAQKKKCLQHRALIVAWLRVNYCLQASGSIAKRDVFVHYIELCRANRIQPSSAASFGKILKMAFPTVKCNRVGPRGASKHHYRGLVLRDAYQLSLENVEPISDAAIAEMMKNMEDNDNNNDDDDDDDDDANGGDAHSAVKSESSTSTYASPTQQYQQPPHGYLSSSSPTPSPPPNHHYNGYAAAQFMPPPAAYAAYPPLPPALSAAIKPAYTLPPPSQPQHAHYMPPHDAKKAESFSWISPDMQESRSTASALQPPSQAAYREWAEKRDLVEFCERNFQSLYDTILRFNCGEGKDQVLTHVAEAWKNLRQYTQHMNLFPETPTSSSTAVVAKAEQAGGTGDYAQGEGKRNQDERYNQLGNDHDELKRKAMLDVGYSSTLPHHQQQFHQPLSAYQHNHHQQSQQQQQHNGKRPYTSSPPQSSQGGIDHYATAAPPALPPPSSSSTTTGSTPPLVSFSGSSSSVSLSWLNSLAFSVNNPQYQQSQPNPYTYTSYHRTAAAGGAGPNAAAASSYQLPAFAASAEGNRGSLEGLEYRSFEWKGAFE